MARSLEFDHCVMLHNEEFFQNLLDTDSIQKITYLAFFLAFFIFFSNFFWISSSERTENTSRMASVPWSQTKQIQSYAKPWLTLTESTQALYQPPLQLSSRVPHYSHGRPKTCPSGLCQESPLGPSLPA